MAKREDPPKGRLLFTDFDASGKGRPLAMLDDDAAPVLPVVSSIEELSRYLDLDFEEDGDYLPDSAPPRFFREPQPESAPAPAPELRPAPPPAAPKPPPDDPNATALISRSLMTSALNEAFPQPRREDWSKTVDSVFAAPTGELNNAGAAWSDEFFAASFQPFDAVDAAVLDDFDPENDDILSVLPPQSPDKRYRPYEGDYRGQRLGVAAPRAQAYGGITRLDEWYRPPEGEAEEERSLRRENWYEPPDSAETAKTIYLEKPPFLPGGVRPSQSRRGSSTSTSAADIFRDLDIDDIWRGRTGESAEFGEGTVILDTDEFLKDPRMAKLAQAQAEARAVSQRLSARRKTEIKSITPEKQFLKIDLAFADPDKEMPERLAPRKPTRVICDEEAFANLDKLLEADTDADGPVASVAPDTPAKESSVADKSGSASAAGIVDSDAKNHGEMPPDAVGGKDGAVAGSWGDIAASAFGEAEPDYLPESDVAMTAVPPSPSDPGAEVEADADVAKAEPADNEEEEEFKLTEPLDPFAAAQRKKPAKKSSPVAAEGEEPDAAVADAAAGEDPEASGTAEAGEGEGGAPQEEAAAVDPMSVFANMDNMDFSDDGLDDDMKAMLDDGEEPEEGGEAAEGQAAAVVEEQPPDGKIARVFFYARKTVKMGPRGILRKIGEMLAWRENWWFYCDLLAAVIASASLAVILSYFLWYRG